MHFPQQHQIFSQEMLFEHLFQNHQSGKPFNDWSLYRLFAKVTVCGNICDVFPELQLDAGID